MNSISSLSLMAQSVSWLNTWRFWRNFVLSLYLHQRSIFPCFRQGHYKWNWIKERGVCYNVAKRKRWPCIRINSFFFCISPKDPLFVWSIYDRNHFDCHSYSYCIQRTFPFCREILKISDLLDYHPLDGIAASSNSYIHVKLKYKICSKM
jgi:hypothetical protein